MNNTIKLVTTAGIASALLLSAIGQASAAQTVTTTKTTTTTVVTTTVIKDDTVKGGTISAGTTATTPKPVKNTTVKTPAMKKVVEPFYKYNGYTGRNADFALDAYFVKALNYDNFKLNNMSVTKKKLAYKKSVKSMVNDTAVYKVGNEVVSMSFPVKNGLVKKADFLKAHKANQIVSDKVSKSRKSVVTYKTMNGKYVANFDKAGFLTSIKITANKLVK